MAQMPEAIILRKTEETKTGVTYCMADVKTNADRIRSMSDEELAEFMKPYDSGCPRWEENPIPCTQRRNCRDCWLDWLREETQ